MRHEESGVDVDISLGLPFEVEAVERSSEHQVGTLTTRLPTPELILIILKAVAHRPKDMLDIEFDTVLNHTWIKTVSCFGCDNLQSCWKHRNCGRTWKEYYRENISSASTRSL